jgi:hypothetical protein
MCVKERLKNIPVNNDNIPVYTNLDQRINRTHRDEPKQTMNLHQAKSLTICYLHLITFGKLAYIVQN